MRAMPATVAGKPPAYGCVIIETINVEISRKAVFCTMVSVSNSRGAATNAKACSLEMWAAVGSS